MTKRARTVELTRAELYELVWTLPFERAARKLKVNTATLGRACGLFNVPRPKPSQENKLWSRQDIERAPLAEGSPAGHQICFVDGSLRLDADRRSLANEDRKRRAKAELNQRVAEKAIRLEVSRKREETEQALQQQRELRLEVRDMNTLALASLGLKRAEGAILAGISATAFGHRLRAAFKRGLRRTHLGPFVLGQLFYPRRHGERPNPHYYPRYSGPAVTLERAIALDEWDEAAQLVKTIINEMPGDDPLFELREWLAQKQGMPYTDAAE